VGELFYDQSIGWIAGVLLAAMVIAIEAGHRLGRKVASRTDDEPYRSHINGIQASLLGVLALLLGFTLSLALQRFDHRSETVVEEANAIGTAYLRGQILAPSLRDEVLQAFQRYVDLRVRENAVSLDHADEREVLLAAAAEVRSELWGHARQAAALDPNMVTTGLFIQALNEAIDAFGRREAALRRHVPEVALLLLVGTLLTSGWMVGISSGMAGHRPSAATYAMSALILLLVLIIVDLDRPRRGLIQIDQSSMLDLKLEIDSALLSAAAWPSATRGIKGH
jgi:hypothetical protein